jgi:hypothetical protein
MTIERIETSLKAELAAAESDTKAELAAIQNEWGAFKAKVKAFLTHPLITFGIGVVLGAIIKAIV